MSTGAEFDIAIVGAGPAGNAAALALADTGITAVQLEAAELPRPKPCGGAIPGDLPVGLGIEDGLDDAVWVNRLVQDYGGTRHAFEGRIEKPMPMVDRARFDQHLSDLAVHRSNGRLTRLTGERVLRIERDDTGLLVVCRGSRMRVRALVAADGARSRIARAVGLNARPTVGIALDAELHVTAACHQRFADAAVFSHGRARGGYAWIFPKSGLRLSCGIGGFARAAVLRRSLHQFLTEHLAISEQLSLVTRGHPLPPYAGHRAIARSGVFLAGDAASLVDPVTGEGIWFALQSGYLAGRVLAWSMGHGDQSLTAEFGTDRGAPERVYQRLVHEHLAVELEVLARLAVPDLLDAPEFFYRNHLRTGFHHVASYRALATVARSRDASRV